MAGKTQSSRALGKSVADADAEARDFADALMAFLAVARRTRGRLQPLFDDITIPQLVLLDAIEECGREGVGAVATFTGLTQPTVTRSTAALVDNGLVEYARHGDGRRKQLALTDRGTTLLQDKRDVVAQHLSSAWTALSAEERHLVTPLLRHLADVVDELF